MACKEGQFDVVELMVNDQFKTFSINLNAQHVNGMTPFDLALSTVIRYSRVIQNKPMNEKSRTSMESALTIDLCNT